MSIERAIHEQWAADYRLTSLVPTGQLFTGATTGPTPRPYVVLERQDKVPAVRTSGGAVDRTRLRFNVWTDGLDQGKQIVMEIARRFDRQNFDQAGILCLNMQRVTETETREENGVWRLAAEYVVMSQ